MAATDDFEVIEHIPIVRQHGGDGFTGVNDAATADADDEIAILFFGEGRALFNGGDFRLPHDGECCRTDAVRRKVRQQFFRALRTTSRHHQRATANVFRIRPNLSNCPRAKNDRFGGGEFKLHKMVGGNTARSVQKMRRVVPTGFHPEKLC